MSYAFPPKRNPHHQHGWPIEIGEDIEINISDATIHDSWVTGSAGG